MASASFHVYASCEKIAMQDTGVIIRSKNRNCKYRELRR